MILGIGEIFCTLGGAQGGAQEGAKGAVLGCFGGANYSFDFCSFLVPISVPMHTTHIFPHLNVCE